MPSEVSRLSEGDNCIPQSNTEFHRGHKLKRRWMDAFVTSSEQNCFKPEQTNKMLGEEDYLVRESNLEDDEIENVEEDDEDVEEPLTEPFEQEDVEVKADDDMFDDWMPNDLKENESLVPKYHPNETNDYDIKIENIEKKVEADKKKSYINFTESTASKTDVQTVGEIGEISEIRETGEIFENPINVMHSVGLIQNTTATESPIDNKKSRTRNYIKQKNTNHYIFQCNICQEKFKRKRYLTRHNERFGPKGCMKPFQCKDCDKSFKTPDQLIRHNNYCDGKKYECIICYKFYPNTSQLKYHQMLHASVDPFPCTECGKGFKRPSDRRSHERIHKEEKAFKCDVCKKRFRFSGQVIKHKITHKDERPFPSGQCEKVFITSSVFDRHQLTHDTGKSFPCNQCGIQLKCRFYLQQHMKLHMGKLYECSVCRKSFAAKSYLKAHMKKLVHKQLSKESPVTNDFDITDTVSDMEYL